MSAQQWHAPGWCADPDGRPRGLCWCGWRGEVRPGPRAARRDAQRHLVEVSS